MTVSGSAANLTWTGNNGNAWDVNNTQNWSGGDTRFQNLDHVTFDDTATATDVSVAAGGVLPGSITFNNNTKEYSVFGAPTTGQTAVNVNGTGVVSLANDGGSYGTISVSNGSTLAVGSAADSAVSINGDVVAQSGSVVRVGTAGITSNSTTTSEDFESFSTGTVFQKQCFDWQSRDGRLAVL